MQRCSCKKIFVPWNPDDTGTCGCNHCGCNRPCCGGTLSSLRCRHACWPDFPYPRVTLSGAITGLPDVSGIRVHALVNGRYETTLTNDYGWYQFRVPRHANVIIFPQRIFGYYREPRFIERIRVATDMAALNFTYIPLAVGQADVDSDDWLANTMSLGSMQSIPEPWPGTPVRYQ